MGRKYNNKTEKLHGENHPKENGKEKSHTQQTEKIKTHRSAEENEGKIREEK